MRNRTKFSIVVLFAIIVSLLSPSSSFAETPQPPLEVDSVEPVFQTISADESIEAIPNATPGLGVNWIVNGAAESGINSWTGGATDFIVSVPYGTPDMPTPQDPGPTIRGTNFFKSDGTNAEKNAWQTWGVGAAQTMLATGKARFTLSGFLGGKGSGTDYALLRVYFGYWDDAPFCKEISYATIGPVTAADRSYKTGLIERKISGLVPAGTNCLSFQLQMMVGAGTAGTAYADNLSFVINGITNYLPVISQSVSQPTNAIPAAPSNLVINQTNLTSLNLSWMDNSNNETGFVIQRAVGTSTTYAEIARVSSNETTFLNSGLTPATTHKYRVSSYNGKGTSTFTGVTGATSPQPATLPNPPANCWTSNTGSSSTELGWTDSSNNEEYFILSWKFPGYDWYTYPQGIEPDATYVTIISLPDNATTLFSIQAHNAAGSSSACQTSATTGNAQNQLTVFNNASYPVVSLEIDGVEQFPVYPMGLVKGNSFQIYLEPGAHSVIATTGFWQNKTDRFYMYSYYQSFTLSSGGYYFLEIPDITIYEMLTQFSPTGQGYWEGYYFDSGANCHTAAFLFSEPGTYQFYIGNSYQGSGGYSLEARLPETFSTVFNVVGHVNGHEGWLLETYGQFYMNNGPASWNQITYVYKPQGYVYNPFCP